MSFASGRSELFGVRVISSSWWQAGLHKIGRYAHQESESTGNSLYSLHV